MNERFIDFYLTMRNLVLIYEYDFVIYEIFDFCRLIFESEYVFSFENLLSHKKSVLILSLHFILDFFFSYIFYQAEFLQNISENCAYLINNMVSLENISNFILYINIIY